MSLALKVEQSESAGAAPAKAQRPMSSAAAVMQSVGAKFLIIGINAGTGILCARALGPTGRGELAAMILWPVLLGSALTLGVPSALTYQMQRSPEKRSELVGAALFIACLTALLGMIVGVVGMPYWLPQYSPHTILFARILLLGTPLTTLLLAGRAALESQGKFSASNKLLFATPALTLIWLVILKLTGTLTPVSAAIAYGPVGIPPLIWMLRRLNEYHPSLRHFREATRLLGSYGLRSYGIDLCGTMALYVDQALVVRLLLPSLMGAYVVALSLSRMLNAFHTSVVMVLFPRSVGLERNHVVAMTGRAARMSTMLTSCAGLVIVIFGPQVLTMLYGAGYRDATAVLRVLVAEVVISGATLVLSQAFMALSRPGVVTTLQIVGLLFTIPLLLLLTPRFGLLGAGLALLISTTVRFISVVVSYPIFLKTGFPQLMPTAEDFTFMAVTVRRRLGGSRRRLVVVGESE